jgi:phosphoglycolate phosphatase-like HAD superfamily hydrolase
MCQLGLPEPTLAQVRAAVGGGLDEAIAKLAGPDKVRALRPHFLHLWEKTNLQDVVALPGASEIIQALRAMGTTCAYTRVPAALSERCVRRRSDGAVVRCRRPAESSVATARLTATLSMAVRAVTSAAERPGFAASTAMTRHSGIDSPKLAK